MLILKFTSFKFTSFALSAVCATMVFAGSALVQHAVAQTPVVIDAAGNVKAVTVSATIAAIDAKNRVVTLKGAEGNAFAVQVGKSVNLAGVKVGDTVDATYIRAVALDFQKGDGIRMNLQQSVTQGANALTRTTVVTNIWAINEAQGSVTVLGPYGQLHQVYLKDPAQLSGVKVGDQMKIVYTAAVLTQLAKKG